MRFSDEKIRLRSQVYEPDYVIVQDSTLIRDVNVFSGMKEGGIVLINTEKKGEYNVPAGVKVIAFDATKIAIEEIGLPITNTTLMGAFAAASGEITLEALKGAIEERFPGKLAATNFAAAKRAYEMIQYRKWQVLPTRNHPGC